VAEAADVLGITTGAVRNRLSRGTLASVKESGTVYVLLPPDTGFARRDAARDTGDTPGDIPQPERDVLISEMRGRIDDLRNQREAER
jgi:hypothetical protein